MELRTWVTISYDDPKIKPDLLWGCHQADERDTWGPGGCSLWMMMEMTAQGELGHRQQGETRISQPGPSGWWLHRGHPVLDPESINVAGRWTEWGALLQAEELVCTEASGEEMGR